MTNTPDEFDLMLSKMEADGLITRNDGMVSLTAEGRRAAFALCETNQAAAELLEEMGRNNPND